MYTSFYIKENRLDECKAIIRSLPSARFKHNPLKEGNQWFIALTMEVSDSSKLNQLFEKWHNEDKPKEISKQSFWKRMFNFLNF